MRWSRTKSDPKPPVSGRQANVHEARAEKYLREQGLRTLERNWHCRLGEIDLIMRDNDSVVFVEVRQRAPTHFANAIESIGPQKIGKLRRAAGIYLAANARLASLPCRFDVVGITGDDLTWLRNAFNGA